MKKIHTQKSKIHGTGIFASEEIKKGEFITHIRGKLSTVGRRLLHTPEEAKMNPDWVGVSMSYWINPSPPFNFLNHSCDPTSGIKGKVRLYALRDIKEGDEITVDYSTIEANPYWEMKCECGARQCRKTTKSVTFLPRALFQKYSPFLPTAFRKFYTRKTELEHSKK